MRTLAERLRADLPGLDDEEINELQDYLTRTRLGSVTDIDLDRYQCLPWGSEDIDEIGRRICGAAVFEGLDRLDDFEISRVMFLTRVAGKHPPGTPVSVTGDGCCAFSMYSDRACYRAGQGDPVPGVDLVPDPLAMLTDGARRRLREVEDANPGVDIEALFIEAVSSRTGKVGVDLCYLGSPKAGTRQLEYIAKEIWHRFRTRTTDLAGPTPSWAVFRPLLGRPTTHEPARRLVDLAVADPGSELVSLPAEDSMRRSAHLVGCFAIFTFALLLVEMGCNGGSPGCIEGQSSTCACSDGRSGAQVCGADGTYGLCECSGGDGDTDSDVDSDGDVDSDTQTDGDIDGDRDSDIDGYFDADFENDVDTSDQEDDSDVQSDPPVCDRGVWEGDLQIQSAEDIEALRGYTIFSGNLTVGRSDLVDLRGLECLTRVDGHLTFYENRHLRSLAGLENLRGYVSVVQFWIDPVIDNLAPLYGIDCIGSITMSTDISTDLVCEAQDWMAELGVRGCRVETHFSPVDC